MSYILIQNAEKLLSALWLPWRAALCNVATSVGTSDQSVKDGVFYIRYLICAITWSSGCQVCECGCEAVAARCLTPPGGRRSALRAGTNTGLNSIAPRPMINNERMIDKHNVLR
jgi:hypothetical protein